MPPAYHMVVDPNMPIPNLRSPYDPEEEVEKEEEEDDTDTPEITINASTQIRGSGNIVSIAQMDSVRIANLITSMLNGSPATKEEAPDTPSPAATPAQTSRTQVRGVKKWANVNITVNCGATIIGDRNIVGPGLGDIARQMQMAQRNQALHAQQVLQKQQQAAVQGQKIGSPPSGMPRGPPQYHGVQTPPMSRSGSEDGGLKRKAEDCAAEGRVKRQC
jgi:hypothetical protein